MTRPEAHEPIQVVILAGGLGTRLGALTGQIPKSLIDVRGKPFLQYQLEWLKSYGIQNVVLCVGHLSEQIESFAGDGREFGLDIFYSHENEKLLGTAGAVKNAEGLLASDFCVMNGDSFLPIDPTRPVGRFRKASPMAMMLTYRNKGALDKSNTRIQDGFVTHYSREANGTDPDFIDYGLLLFRKETLNLIPPGEFHDMDMLYQQLIELKELSAYTVTEPFYEVGSHDGLGRFSQYVEKSGLLTP